LSGPVADFLCNICSHYSRGVPLPQVENRECPTCRNCGSSLRMRSLMHLLSMELFGRALAVPEFPVDKSVVGVGLSDWERYSHWLERSFTYTNTFYHREPRLDITRPDPALAGRFTFLIASDVFEHIPVEGLRAAFANAHDLLADDGFMLFTVPFRGDGETVEHFPNLHDFTIEESGGARTLVNTTADGKREVFRDLVFHGGDGSTLEMRRFSRRGLRREFAAAGFGSVRMRADHYPLFGVLWPDADDVPVVARKSRVPRQPVRRMKWRLRRALGIL